MVHLPMTIINPSPQQNRMDILHFADECWWFAFGTWWVSDLPTSTTEGPKRFRADQWPTWPALSHPNLLRTNGKEFPALVGWHCWHCLLLSCYLCAAGLLSAHSHDTSRSRTVPSSAIAREISHDLFLCPASFFLVCHQDTLQQRKNCRPSCWRQAVQCHPCLDSERTSKGFTRICGTTERGCSKSL